MTVFVKRSSLNLFVRKQKYGNRSSVYNGRAYHSIKEANHAAELDMLKKATDRREKVVEWKPQHIVDIYLDGVKLTTRPTTKKLFRMIPDFLVTYADGHREIHEVKSSFTATLGDWKRNWMILEAIMEEEDPELVLVVIK